MRCCSPSNSCGNHRCTLVWCNIGGKAGTTKLGEALLGKGGKEGVTQFKQNSAARERVQQGPSVRREVWAWITNRDEDHRGKYGSRSGTSLNLCRSQSF